MINKERALNTRQRQVLDFIREEVRRTGYPPSIREICQAVGLSSTSTVHSHLSKLEDLGFIKRDPSKPRAVELLEDSSWRQKRLVPLPLVGAVQAGVPITAEECVEDTFPFPEALVGPDDCFFLEVKGDSMIGAGIIEGDMVIVRQQQTADNGDIVVALLEQSDATIKRFFKEKDHIRLQPENEEYEPILTRDCTIMGKVVGLFRKM